MAKNINPNQSGIVQTNSVNNPNVDHMRGRNMFPQSFMHPSTCRYGEVDPVLAFKCERGDILPYKFVTDLNTFTLASPLKSEVKMYSAAFKVPMQALYPRNWEIMMPFPNKGDDVPDDSRCLFSVWKFLSTVNDNISSDNISRAIRNTFLLESVLSAGSLFSKFNYHFDSYKGMVRDGDSQYGYQFFDDYFDNHFIPYLKLLLVATDSVIRQLSNDDVVIYRVTSDRDLIGSKWSQIGYYISFRRALELLRTGEWYVVEGSSPPSADLFPKFTITIGNSLPINIEPIVAYNCACSHFFNNPKVDFVYSWELYRDNMQSLVYYDGSPVPVFEWNGILKQYDVFSQAVLNHALSGLSGFAEDDFYFAHTSFWYNLFSFHRSLRFGDYFTGVHPEPLAVGDINAPVVDGSVNAIDITQKLQLTRLLNKVNIAGPRKDDQLVALYGGPLPDAPKDVPIRLSLEEFNVTGFEVNNTGDLQASSDATNITTTNLRLSDSKFMFEAQIDEPCWIIAVQYFEAHRIYTRTLDRFAYHRDRLDDFQPDLQYVGDQDIKSSELDAVNGDETTPFAYNLRNMEYKQRYSYASGGFIRHLPSWLFITDNLDGNPPASHITPDYIRSSPSEFDRFYKSLTGYSLASYFHFITTNTNVLAPYRQMVYAPEILA